MDIWIILDGEKVGPIHDFEIRRKIETRELPATTPAWHEGLDAWKPLIEIDLFTREFEIAVIPPPADKLPPPLPKKTAYIRRFWARWFDLYLYTGLWWFAMWAAGQDIKAALLNPWLMFFHCVPWFALEALLIHKFRTTPGKWLLGLQVVNNDSSQLDLAASIRRSLRVMFSGVGFGWGLLAVFCQALSLFTAKRLGTPLWDLRGGHQVVINSLCPVRIVVLICLFAGALQLQMIVVSPYLFEMAGKSFPSIKEQYEKNQPWHLPERFKKP